MVESAGAPFTTGFLAKFQVGDASVNAGSVPLAVIAMVSAAIAAFFYLRWTMALYVEDSVEATRVVVPKATGVVIGLGVAMTLVFGVWPGPLAALAQHATVLFAP